MVLLIPLLPVIGFILLIYAADRSKAPRMKWLELARPHEIGFAFAALLAPIITMSYCIWSGSVPFYPRHGISAMFPATLIITVLLIRVVRRNAQVGVMAAALILVMFCQIKAGTRNSMEPFDNASTSYRAVRTDIPFVTASGLTFLEMDHREGPEFIHRLYYLTDRESAVRYHTTIFEGLPIIRQWFPVRANVTPFHEFISHHRQFLVLATAGFPEDWLLMKLQADGAQIRLLRNEKTGYRDHELYEVTLKAE
jgi:hypothetical protein